MFTGIISHTGQLLASDKRGENSRLRIGCPSDFLADSTTGDSIAVEGVCLTALEIRAESFEADVSLETLRRTTLGARSVGEGLNLERSLRLGDALGGHLVMGHVDGVGRVVSITPHGDSVQMRFAAPSELASLIAHKGSIAVDGISLTPVAVAGSEFEVWVIPETLRRTTLGQRGVGDGVNLEVDILSRYVARQLEGAKGRVTMELLGEEGFLK